MSPDQTKSITWHPLTLLPEISNDDSVCKHTYVVAITCDVSNEIDTAYMFQHSYHVKVSTTNSFLWRAKGSVSKERSWHASIVISSSGLFV